MLSLPIEGDLIEIPDNSKAFRVALNAITDAEKENKVPLDVMVDALRLAKRFDMKCPMARIKEKLHDCCDGPRLLVVACQQTPIDRLLARTALSHFKDGMAMDGKIFRSQFSYPDTGYASPRPDNLTTDFLKALTVSGALALVKAMDDSDVTGEFTYKHYDWAKVPAAFVKHLTHLEG